MLTSYLWRKNAPVETGVTRAQMYSALNDKDALIWVDLEDPNEFESDCLVEIFNFHDLAVEDCLSDASQPKVDDYDEYLFLVMNGFRFEASEEKKEGDLQLAELDIFFGKNYVVTFHKAPMKTIQLLRDNLKKKPERFSGERSGALFHAILDQLVDNYQPVIDQYEDKMDTLEEKIFSSPAPDYLATLLQAKKEIFLLRRTISPQRDTIYSLAKNMTPFIDENQRMYFKDIYDHLFQLYQVVDGFHEHLASLLQVYFSYSSFKLNEVIKHLTVLATIAMPPVIIASIYGMNFKHMPELDWEHGYFFAIFLSVASSTLMLLWMRIKKWL